MRKLKLELDNLEVDSFSTASQDESRGTVRGHTGNPECPAYATHEFASCYHTDCGQRTCDWNACYGTGGTGGTYNTQCGQYTCATPEGTCPY